MRSHLALALALALGAALAPGTLACGPAASSPASNPTNAAAPTAPTAPKAATPTDLTVTLEKSPESGKADKVGPNDGPLRPDGVEDYAFTASVDGPIAALFLVGVDEHGLPTGQFQADTLVANQERPEELGEMRGSATAGLGVFEGDKVLNGADGALPALTAAKRRLTLYVAKALELQPGMRLRLYVLRPAQSLVAGVTLTN